MSPKMGRCIARGPNLSAFRNPSQFFGGCGGFQRNSPIGAWANGMPLKERTPETSCFPSSVPLAIVTRAWAKTPAVGMVVTNKLIRKNLVRSDVLIFTSCTRSSWPDVAKPQSWRQPTCIKYSLPQVSEFSLLRAGSVLLGLGSPGCYRATAKGRGCQAVEAVGIMRPLGIVEVIRAGDKCNGAHWRPDG